MAVLTMTVDSLIKSGFDFGLKDYPIYQESHREELNKKILNHFRFDEIGQETAEMFKFYLNMTLEEIMPYYNQLYKSCDVEFNPLWNVELTETYDFTGTNTGKNTTGDTTTNTVTNSGTDKQENTNTTTYGKVDSNTGTVGNKSDVLDIRSDTTAGNVSVEDIKNNVYASEASHSKGENTQTLNTKNASTGSDTVKLNVATTLGSKRISQNGGTVVIESNDGSKQHFTRKQEGSSAGLPFSTAIKKWREIMINIDKMILDDKELVECFAMVYSTNSFDTEEMGWF